MDDRTTEDLFPEDTKKIEDGTDTNVGSESDELVSRRAVIKSVTQEYNRRRTGDGLKLAWIEKAINETPAAQPERKAGEWIYKHENGVDSWECSECGYRENIKDGGIHQFCSACGTLMKKAYGVYANEWLGL